MFCTQDEMDQLNQPEFKFSMNWLSFLTSLLESYQDLDDASCDDIIAEWHAERDHIRYCCQSFQPRLFP